MADEDHTDTLPPLTDPAPEPPHPEPVEQSTAADRLRAFEDEHFGADCVRIEGKVERGIGSPYARMSDEDKAKYAEIERLIVTEQKLADATAALAQAEADHADAEMAVYG